MWHCISCASLIFPTGAGTTSAASVLPSGFLISRYWLCPCSALSSILSVGNLAMNKTHKVSRLVLLQLCMETDKKMRTSMNRIKARWCKGPWRKSNRVTGRSFGWVVMGKEGLSEEGTPDLKPE